MSPDSVDHPRTDPDAVAQHAFTKGRKGYDTDEVRAFLVSLASEIRDLHRERDDLTRRLAEVERRAADPRDLDEESVTQLLGEETARVLVDARKAATEIRTKADDEATALRESANAEASEVRSAAEQYAASVRTLADEGEAKIRSEAEEYARTIRDAADSETAEQRSAADTYSSEVRANADREVSEQRSAAQKEVDELTSRARSVLDERTAEAEAAATEVRTEADEYSERVRREADEYAATSRSEAVAEADRLVEDAREQGRTMVQEAREYRERVIGDLAERRRAAREELDGVVRSRDAVAVTLTDVSTQIERSQRALRDVSVDPAGLSDGAADRRFLAVTPPVDFDEPADDDDEDEDDSDDEQPVWSDDEPGPDSAAEEPVAEDGSDEAEAEDELEPEAESEPASEADGAEAEPEDEEPVEADVDDAPASEPEDEADPEPEAEGDTAPTSVAAVEGDAAAPGIDDLFARIRAERADAGPESADAEPETVVDTEPVEVEVIDPELAEEAVTAAGDETADDADERDAVVDADAEMLDRRDATTDEIERQLARRLKRVLSDEQNEALHDLRGVKGAPTAEEVLPGEDDHRARYRAAVLEDLEAAERAGASFYGEAPTRTADVGDIADELAVDLVRQVRVRLERSFDDSDDPDDVAEGIRTLYREWKTQRIADAARHFVVIAFSRGVAEAAADGTAFRWLVDHGDAAAPDCADNALAGVVTKGEPFPTGDLCPPVHPGCRCLLVPAE